MLEINNRWPLVDLLPAFVALCKTYQTTENPLSSDRLIFLISDSYEPWPAYTYQPFSSSHPRNANPPRSSTEASTRVAKRLPLIALSANGKISPLNELQGATSSSDSRPVWLTLVSVLNFLAGRIADDRIVASTPPRHHHFDSSRTLLPEYEGKRYRRIASAVAMVAAQRGSLAEGVEASAMNVLHRVVGE